MEQQQQQQHEQLISSVVNPDPDIHDEPPVRVEPLVSAFSRDGPDFLDDSTDPEDQTLPIVARWNYLQQSREAGCSLTIAEVLELIELKFLMTTVRWLPLHLDGSQRVIALNLVYTTVGLDLPALFDARSILDHDSAIIPVRGTFLDLPAIHEHYSRVLRRHTAYVTNLHRESFAFRFYVFDKQDYVKDGFLMFLGNGGVWTSSARRVVPCLRSRSIYAAKKRTIKQYLQNEALYVGSFGAHAGQLIGEITSWGTVA